MSRRWLVAVSVFAHVCPLIALFVAGVWRIDRVYAGPLHVELTQQFRQPEPAAGGGARQVEPPKIIPKERAHGRRQPKLPSDPPNPPTATATTTEGPSVGNGPGTSDASPDATCLENCDVGQPAAPVCGNGAREVGEACDDGNTRDGDGCSASCQIEAPPPPPATVAPDVLARLRISGETQVHPDDATQRQMQLDGTGKVDATAKFCVSATGRVESARMLKPTGYRVYDTELLAAIRDWRYEPYRVDCAAVSACSVVRFVYTLH